MGGIDRDGYGIFSYEAKSYRAAKVALEIDGRAVPDGMYACHHCDNPRCVRPSHLYPGSPKDNVRDMIARGRNQKGSGHYAARLTEDDVRQIRSSNDSLAKLAARYGVCASNISAIIARKTWRHL